MDIRKIRKLIELIDETGVAEIEIHEGEESVRICRSNPQTTVVTVPEPAASPVTVAATAPVQAPLQSANTSPEITAKDNEHIITAPMVGTVYFAPSPDADPYVLEGQGVTSGDTLCLIEAMKMFNEIETDIDGVIRKIHVDSGQPVEFGQPLFTIETD